MAPSTPDLCNKFLELQWRWSEQKNRCNNTEERAYQYCTPRRRRLPQKQNDESLLITPQLQQDKLAISIASSVEGESVYERLYRTEIKEQSKNRHCRRRSRCYYEEPIPSLELRLSYNPQLSTNRLSSCRYPHLLPLTKNNGDEMTAATTAASSFTSNSVFERLYRNEYNAQRETHNNKSSREEVSCLSDASVQSPPRTQRKLCFQKRACKNAHKEEEVCLNQQELNTTILMESYEILANDNELLKFSSEERTNWQKSSASLKDNNNGGEANSINDQLHITNLKRTHLVTNSKSKEVYLIGESCCTNSDNNNGLRKSKGGYGIYISQSGAKFTYVGEILNNLPHGYGILKENNGKSIYCGYFLHGKKHGIGSLTQQQIDSCTTQFFDDFHYYGSFQNDLFHGKGTIEYADGTTSVGAWLKGENVGIWLKGETINNETDSIIG